MITYKRATKGYTILELLVVMTISGLVLAYGIPSLAETLRQNRAANYANDFIVDLQLARVEAIKRGTSVTICPGNSADMDACGASTDWNNGWIIFVDNNDDGAMASTNDRIKIHNNLNRSMSINTASTGITFSSEGFVTAGSGNYTVESTGCEGNHARLVNISAVGRANTNPTACS